MIVFWYLILLNYIEAIVRIPISKEIPSSFSNEKIIESFVKIPMVAEIDVGTPSQKVKLSVDLYEYSTVIFGSEMAKNSSKFNESLSVTYKTNNTKKENFYTVKFPTGYVGNDKFYIGNANLDNYNFVLATNTSLTTGMGFIGFNPGHGMRSILYETNFILQMKKRDFIESYAFTIAIKNSYKGEVIIGNYPHEYNDNFKEEELKMIKTIPYFYALIWGFNFNVTYNKISVNKKSEDFAEIFADADYIVGSQALFEEVMTSFFQKYINQKECEVDTFYDKYWFICNKTIDLKEFKKLEFYQKELNYSFVFDYHELFEEKGDKLYFKVCFFKEAKFFNYWIIGIPFLKKYQLVFDQDKKLIGLYIPKEHKFKFKIEWAIIAVLVIICILLLYFLIIRNRNMERKKRAVELVDGYEYEPVK